MTTTDKTKALLAGAKPWRNAGGGYLDVGAEEGFADVIKWDNAELAAHLRNTAEHYVAVAEAARRVRSGYQLDVDDNVCAVDLCKALDALDAAGGGG